jgi:hypothetical protein
MLSCVFAKEFWFKLLQNVYLQELAPHSDESSFTGVVAKEKWESFWIAAQKRSPFRPHWGLAAPDIFLDTMLVRRTWEACPIDCTKGLGNIYGNRSQICWPKDKTYRYAHLEELVHSVAVENAPEHKVTCESEPAGEKHGEGKTAAERQPPRASRCVAATSSWGWRLGVAKTHTPRPKTPFLAHQILKWFYDTSSGTATRAARIDLLIGWAKALRVQARWTWWFRWFRPPERNTIRPRENVRRIVVYAIQLWGWACLKGV